MPKMRKRVNQSKNGVRVIVHRCDDGTMVDCKCTCFGHPYRVHSAEDCPYFKKQCKEEQ